MEEKKEQKQGSNKAFIIIAIMALLLAGVSYLYIDSKTNLTNDTKENTEKKDKQSEEINKEKEELTEEDKKNIEAIALEMFDETLNGGLTKISENYGAIHFMSFNSMLANLNFNDKNKLYYALNKTANSTRTSTEFDNGNDYENYQKNVSDVKLIYKKYFGTSTFDSTLFTSSYGKCPNYTYIQKYDAFYVLEMCGGAGPLYDHIYIDNVTKDNDNYYAELYLLTVSLNNNNMEIRDYASNTDGTLIYSKQASDDINMDSDYSSIIKENLPKLTKYVMTLKKDETGNYYYVNLEKK